VATANALPVLEFKQNANLGARIRERSERKAKKKFSSPRRGEVKSQLFGCDCTDHL